jgi:hypothetical protein
MGLGRLAPKGRTSLPLNFKGISDEAADLHGLASVEETKHAQRRGN